MADADAGGHIPLLLLVCSGFMFIARFARLGRGAGRGDASRTGAGTGRAPNSTYCIRSAGRYKALIKHEDCMTSPSKFPAMDGVLDLLVL